MTDKKEHVYRGVRIKENPNDVGECHVYVDGKPLCHVVHHSPDGFNWGYGGSGPADLALSILAHHFDERPSEEQLEWGWCLCWLYHQDFKWLLLAPIQLDDWELDTSLVQHTIDAIDKTHVDNTSWTERKEHLKQYPTMKDCFEAK